MNIYRYIIYIFLAFSTAYSADVVSAPQVLDTNSLSKLFDLHFQQTFVYQYHPAFHAAYTGNHSLNPEAENTLSLTTTLMTESKLWSGASVVFHPEVSGGTGFSKVQGIAGFSNNEIERVGRPDPTFYVARFFLQQAFNLSSKTNDASDKLLTFRLGKFCMPDYFDNNKYSHDARYQFINWGLVINGAWDYPADTRGYTYSFMTEYAQKDFALRLAASMVPAEPNGPIDPFLTGFWSSNNPSKNHAFTFEIEKPWTLWGHEGKARILLFSNSCKSADYNEAITLNAINPDSTAAIRRDGANKSGIGINLEQEINSTNGIFLRAAWNNGKTESWMFTEIDRSLSFGWLTQGTSWHRPDDALGLAFSFNGLSDEHKNFLKSGGYGFILGDGNLNYGIESQFEAFYRYNLSTSFQLSLFYQYVVNPAYNRDRGPVAIYSLRTHIEL